MSIVQTLHLVHLAFIAATIVMLVGAAFQASRSRFQ